MEALKERLKVMREQLVKEKERLEQMVKDAVGKDVELEDLEKLKERLELEKQKLVSEIKELMGKVEEVLREDK